MSYNEIQTTGFTKANLPLNSNSPLVIGDDIFAVEYDPDTGNVRLKGKGTFGSTSLTPVFWENGEWTEVGKKRVLTKISKDDEKQWVKLIDQSVEDYLKNPNNIGKRPEYLPSISSPSFTAPKGTIDPEVFKSLYEQKEDGKYYNKFDGSLLSDSLVPEEFKIENQDKKIFSETTEIEEVVTKPPKSLNAFQVEAYTDLIQTNPNDPIWQNAIKDLKINYDSQLGNVTPLFADGLDYETHENYLNKKEHYEEDASKINLKPLNGTTGRRVTTASKQFKSFAVTTETALTNFLSAATNLDDSLLDLPGQIKSTAALIAGGAQGFVGQMGNALSEGLITGIQGGLSNIATKIFSAIPGFNKALEIITRAQSSLVGPVSLVFKGLNCLASKVVTALQGVVEDMLTAFVKNALNAPACAINQFIGAVLNKVNSLVDSFVTPLTGGISKLLGPLFNVKNILSRGINLFDKVGDFFNCGTDSDDDGKGGSSSNEYKIGKPASSKGKGTEDQQNILDKSTEIANTLSKQISNFGKGLESGTQTKITNFEKQYGQLTIFGSKVSEAADFNLGSDCYTGNVFKCGAPTADIFGGDGVGASGKVILGNFINKIDPDDLYGEIKRTASIVGVEITNPGEGYTEAPIIDFTDSCDQGFGAYGKVIIEKNVNSPRYGQVTNVIIISEGENYPVDSPANVGNLFIKEIVVQNGGTGYENAFIEDKCMNLKTIDGKITSVEITCQKPYLSTPTINIINGGIGAVLYPIMSSTINESNQNLEIIESIDCVGAYPKPGEN